MHWARISARLPHEDPVQAFRRSRLPRDPGSRRRGHGGRASRFAGAIGSERELHDRRPPGSGPAHDRRQPRPRMAEHRRRPAVHVPAPPLLERVPEHAVDVGPGRGAAGRALRRYRSGLRLHAPEGSPAPREPRRRPDALPPIRAPRRLQRRRPHAGGGHDAGAGRPGGFRSLPDRVDISGSSRPARARGLGPRLRLRRSVVPQDRGPSRGGVERPSVPFPRGVLLRLRLVRRAADDAARADGRGYGDDCRGRRWTTPTGRARCASRRRTSTISPGRRARSFVERTARFDDDGYAPVDIRLLVQPEHAGLADRYLDATKTALQSLRRLVGALPVRPRDRGRRPVGIHVGGHGVPDPLHL